MDPIIKKLVISYLERTISRDDEILLVQWLKENPKARKELYDFRQIWDLSGSVGSFGKDQVEQEWLKLLKQIESLSTKTSKKGGFVMYWLPRIAAVFLLGAIVSFLVTYRALNPKVSNVVYNEIAAPAGAKSKITLPDGSLIWLNAGSNIKYSSNYGKKQREVFLTGEAFFDVVTNRSKVFLVKTEDLNIKAYGTSFNVKSYPEENTVEATLIEGKIGINRTKFADKKVDEVVLEPNQRVVYYKPLKRSEANEFVVDSENEKVNTETEEPQRQKLTYMISKGIDPEPFAKWKEGVLVINSESLEELAIKLERKYDVKIHFSTNEIKKLKFSGSLENETVEQVIEAIGIAAQIDYKIEEREITFYN